MSTMIVKYYPSLFAKIIQEQYQPQIVKMLTGFVSFNFKKGKLKEEAALQVIHKIHQVIINSTLRDVLLENRKQFLIDFVKLLKTIL